jgi:hypothetical protein
VNELVRGDGEKDGSDCQRTQNGAQRMELTRFAHGLECHPGSGKLFGAERVREDQAEVSRLGHNPVTQLGNAAQSGRRSLYFFEPNTGQCMPAVIHGPAQGPEHD